MTLPYFCIFVIISPFKRSWPFICTNLNQLHPRILPTKFGWNWPSGSGEEVENVKSLQTDRRTTGDQNSSGELTINSVAGTHNTPVRCTIQIITSIQITRHQSFLKTIATWVMYDNSSIVILHLKIYQYIAWIVPCLKKYFNAYFQFITFSTMK